MVSLEWTFYLTGILSKYFNKTYKNVPHDISRIIDKKLYIVYRPNHGLLYALRQGFLAIDIINLLAKQRSNPLSSWVKYKIQTDPYFKIKVMFASSFQRSGRESEIGSSANPKLYNAYERTDAIYFQTEATKHIGTLFKDKHEMLIYKEAILWSTVDEGLLLEKNCQSLYFLRKILHTAHLLDLRRIPDFDIQQIKKNSIETLFGDINIYQHKKIAIIDHLLYCSGNYLNITGDRDVITFKRFYSDEFFILSNNLRLLAITLYKTHKNVAPK